jgi:predicted ATPase
MALSQEMRRLGNKWTANTGWPKRLEWIEISGLRGWSGQRIDFNFPIVAIVGENGAGKSTVIQAAASVFQPPDRRLYPTEFFMDTPWERVENAEVKFSVREGNASRIESIRKLTERWRGYSHRPERYVNYIDLSRVQPILARVGYLRLANPQLKEDVSDEWETNRVKRLSQVMGRQYDRARMATTVLDSKRAVPILHRSGSAVSGFHQGAGETTIAELLQVQVNQTALVLIDEIETSLHPRVQRRVIRWLADQCRQLDLQIILTTHSPYVLSELPPEARVYLMNEGDQRSVVTGVSPEFAMTKMDEENHPECDLFVEDERSGTLLREILVKTRPLLVPRCQTVAYGAASVGYALGIMANQGRFPRPTCVYIDGDQETRDGCTRLPGSDAPERVVFGELQKQNWADLSTRLNRTFSQVADACSSAMAYADHHEWLRLAGDKLLLGTNILWHAMCAAWVATCLDDLTADTMAAPVELALADGAKVSVSSVPQQPSLQFGGGA